MVETILLIASAIALFMAVDSRMGARTSQERLAELRRTPLIDPETGFLSTSIFEERATAELRRAHRMDGGLEFIAWRLPEHQFADLAIDLRASLQFPAVGFRLDERMLAAIFPIPGEAQHVAAAERLCAAPDVELVFRRRFPADGETLQELAPEALTIE